MGNGAYFTYICGNDLSGGLLGRHLALFLGESHILLCAPTYLAVHRASNSMMRPLYPRLMGTLCPSSMSTKDSTSIESVRTSFTNCTSKMADRCTRMKDLGSSLLSKFVIVSRRRWLSFSVQIRT